MAATDSGASAPRDFINVNVGVLGHVDSGKTHLVRVLSTHLSTAALDKHPQSQERGMTLDLGFSSFRLASRVPNSPELQITLVDCPGHASLFKTILGGVHIIDSVLLVVDIQKGLQPQTIECLLLAELAVQAQIVVALNKIDLIPEHERDTKIQQVEREIRSFLEQNFTFPQPQNGSHGRVKDVRIVPVAAAPASDTNDGSIASDAAAAAAVGIDTLVDAIQATLPVPKRDGSGPLCYAIDHCFSMQGNGTILTGTVLSGSVQVGDEIELPGLQVTKKIKSMQMFKQSVTRATQGDRVALRVNGLDASLVERGMAITPKSLPFVRQVVVPVHQVKMFQGSCKSGGKIHVTIGHTTVIAVATFFKRHTQQHTLSKSHSFDASEIYQAVSELQSPTTDTTDTETKPASFQVFALLQFEQPVICPPNAIVVCSRFDLDPKKFHCRLAFHAMIQAIVWDDDDDDGDGVCAAGTSCVAPQSIRLRDLKIGNIKSRTGVVDKLVQKHDTPVSEVLARDMFAKDVDWQVYTGATVLCEQTKRLGKILGPFGKSGKFRIELLPATKGNSQPVSGEKIILRFIKLATIRPLRRDAVKTGAKSSSSGPAAGTKAKNDHRKLLQDERILYPEAFEVKEEPESPVFPPASSVLAAVGVQPATVRATGKIERLKGETTADGRNPFVIVSGLFTDEMAAAAAMGVVVRCLVSNTKTGTVVETGEIEKPFGKAGKVRVTFPAHGGTLAQVGDVIELW